MIRLLCFVLMLIPSVVLAVPGTLPAPTLKEGQFVYTIPDNFDPPGIGHFGLEAIQEVAKGLHFPFYVVIVDHLPNLNQEQADEATQRQYTSRGDDFKADYAVDKLPEDWAAANPSFRTDVSSVFLLAYTPRKFRMLAGSKWKLDLNLERNNLLPYTEPFKRATTGTPKDPRNGIINVIRYFDGYVFDQTDPDRIKARAEAAATVAEEQRKAAEAAQAAVKEQAAAALLATAQGKFTTAKVDAKTLLMGEGNTCQTLRRWNKPWTKHKRSQTLT